MDLTNATGTSQRREIPAAQAKRSPRWKWLLTLGLAIVAGVAAGAYCWDRPISAPAFASGQGNFTQEAGARADAAMSVTAVRPRAGDMDRTTTQPGTVQAFELAQLYAGASGYLKTQSVDIGDRVKAGQVLAVIDVPDLDKLVQKCDATLLQANARVRQMQARVLSSRADLEAAQAAVTLAEANAKSKSAELRFRQKQLDRMKELFALKSVDERLVDEKTEQRDATQEGQRAAVAAIAASKAQVSAASAKIEQAQADVTEAESEVKVARAELEKAQVMVRFATVVCPFDGVVTNRTLFPGDYVRAAREGGGQAPILTVQRTDLMRVVVQIPDRDVPFADPGDLAMVEIDALPGEKLPAKVSRVARTEDPQTRLMHIEIDLPNPTGKIVQGMYGRVKIVLEKSNLLSVPSSCVIGKSEDGGRAAVFVVRDGKAHKVSVRLAEDNGVKVGVVAGLKADDLVVRQPPSGLTDGTPVVAAIDGQTASAAGH